MESLLEKQRQAIEQLNRIIINYAKDSKTRKTIDYYKKKIEELDYWHTEFVTTNNKLRPFEALSDQNYFTENKFDEAMGSQCNHMEVLQSALQSLEYDSSGSSNKNTNEIELNLSGKTNESGQNTLVNEYAPINKLLIVQQNEVKELINEINLVAENVSIGYAKAQIESLKMVWSDFRQSSIEFLASNSSNAVKLEYTELQRSYTTAKGILNDKINQGNSKSNVELPALKIPKFHGKNTEWRTFIELFDRIVHNNNKINNAIKMQYLKTSLKHDAAKLVAHIAPTAENYVICYDILKNRFDNKRELLSNLFDFKPRKT